MKRITYFLSSLAFILVFSGNAFAQTVEASASIVEDLVVTINEDLSFGQISNSQTTDAVIDPNGTNSGTGNTTTLGKATVTASDGASINISFSTPASLSDGTNTIGFTGNYTGSETNDASASTGLDEADTNTIHLGASNDTYYIYLGGTLEGTEINGAPTGTYTGTITVTVNYL